MALSAYAGYASYDVGTSLGRTDVRDVSPLMFAALQQDHDLISRIKVGAPATNQKAEWVEQSLNPDSIVLEAGTSSVEDGATETLFTATAAEIATVKIGDLLKNKTQNIAEVLQVTAKPTSTTLTVVRGHGATSGSASHAAGNEFWVMPGNQQGSARGTDRTKSRVTRYNWTQILDVDVQVSRTMMNTAMYNVADEFTSSVAQRTIEAKRYLANAIINSATQGSTAPSDTVYPYMSGLIEMINYSGDPMTPASANTATIDSSTTTLTYDALSDLVGLIYTQGGAGAGSNLLIITGQAQYEVIATWPDSQVRRQYGPQGQQYGGFVDSIMTKQGIAADVMLEPYVPVGRLLVVDLNRIELAPLANSAWNMYSSPLGEAGNDFQGARLLGEWTIKVHNAGAAHGMMTALT